MTRAERLRIARDRAFERYLAVRKAGGSSQQKRRALERATIAWWKATKGKAK